MADDELPHGPVDVIMIGFVDGQFHGQIATALAEVVDGGLVRVIDLVFLTKDADGTVGALEVDEVDALTGGAFARMDGDYGGLLSDGDIETAAEQLAAGESVAVVVLEHLWARRLVAAVRSANGQMLATERVPGDVVEAAFAALQDA